MCTPDAKRPFLSVSPATPESSLVDQLSDLLDLKLNPILARLDSIEQRAFVEMKQEVTAMKNDVEDLRKENHELKERLISLESQSRRDNLRFDGIPEAPSETWQQSEKAVRQVITDLGLNEADIKIARAHRNGPSNSGRPRTILCKFQYFKDRESVFSAKKDLSAELRISEDFPPEIDERRKILMPIFIEARKHKNPKMDVKLRVDKLYINKQLFTVDTLHLLPDFLKPESIYTRECNNKIFFFTKNSPLSNMYPAPFVSDGKAYTCVEQYLMEKKAQHFGDALAAEAIMKTPDPFKQKYLGSQVKGYNHKVWGAKAQDIMKAALHKKFEQNPLLKTKLLSTRNKELVEANPKDTFWGAGISIHDQDKLEKGSYPGKNTLGKLMMEVRNELL